MVVPAAPQRTLADVLRVLSLEAADSLFECLEDAHCMAEARLAHRSLRAVLDVSTRALDLAPHDWHHIRGGVPALPPLSRWPRCTDLGAMLGTTADGDDSDGDEGGAGGRPRGAAARRNSTDRLHLWLLMQPAAERQRLTTLSLRLNKESLDRAREPGGHSVAVTGAEVAALVACLPGLQTLNLQALRPSVLLDSPLQAQLLMGGLAAAAPGLRRLLLPSCRLLEHLHLLSGGPSGPGSGGGASGGAGGGSGNEGGDNSGCGLQHLLVVAPTEEGRLTAAGAAGLSRLSHLVSLSLVSCFDDGGDMAPVAVLMCSLPPSLMNLDLAGLRPRASPSFINLSARLRGGALTKLRLSTAVDALGVSLRALAVLAEEVLGPGRVVGPGGLPLLSIERLTVATDGDVDALATGPELAAVTRLLRQCGRVEVGSLLLGPATTEAAAAQAAELLGPPAELHLEGFSPHTAFTLRMPTCRPAPERGQEARGMLRAGTALGDVRLSPGLPPPSVVVDLTLQRMLAAAAFDGGGSTGEAVSSSSSSSGIAASRGQEQEQGQAQGGEAARARPGVVMVRGPLVAVLMQTPNALQAWLSWLAGRVMEDVVDEMLAVEVQAGGLVLPLVSYQLLPAAGAVLVECSPWVPAAAAALMALVASASSGRGAGAAEAAVVGAQGWEDEEEEEGEPTFGRCRLAGCFLKALEQAVADICRPLAAEAAVGGDTVSLEGVTFAEQLEWALALLRHLGGVLPGEVTW